MNSFFFETQKSVAVYMALGFFLAACSSDIAPRGNESRGEPLRFGPEVSLGTAEANPATPFLRFAPDGRLFAIWTEDETGQPTKVKQPIGASSIRQDGALATARGIIGCIV